MTVRGVETVAAAAALSILFAIPAADAAESGREGGNNMGWQANPEMVRSKSKDKKFIYDESRVPDYTLPDPLVTHAGRRVDDPLLWQRVRRAEILELFRLHVYGRAPVAPDRVSYEVHEKSTSVLGGKAVRRQVDIRLTGNGREASIGLLIYLPADSSTRPAPVFTLLNFGGNHTIDPDPAIRITKSWMRGKFKPPEKHRGRSSGRYPVERIVERGYGLVTAYYGDIDPDTHDGFKNGIHSLYDPPGDRPEDAWGSVGAWAWGLSRMMDYFETDDAIDHKRVSVLGHSRLGKTSLWAGAQDERFAIVISNDSGCGGAALSRRCYGEHVARINHNFPHWFCETFKKYSGDEGALPVDQHMLIALVAPRPVYVASADLDLWADPRGEFLSAKGADPVYRLLGTEGLPVSEMPPLDTPLMGRIGYHVRTGKHDLSVYDWDQYMTFADKHLKR